MSADIRECCIRGCVVLIAVDQIMCERHWRHVPKEIRNRIASTRGQKRSAAILAAIEAVRVRA